ncbi:MAG: hypothetical protein ACOY3K_02240 [Candidatus Omnitrophota bacterium]
MREMLSLIAVLLMLSGFTWGEKPSETSNVAEGATSDAAATGTAFENDTTNDLTASQGGIKKAFGTSEPDELKARISALARVSKALRALNEARRKKQD